MRNIVKSWFLKIWVNNFIKRVQIEIFEFIVKSLIIGFIKFNYFINQNGEIIKDFKDNLK